jgi:hypothetical protein
MDEDQLDDLKQFVATTVSQTEKRLDAKFTHEITQVRNELRALRGEMMDGFSGVGEAIETIHDLMTKRDAEVDKRLTRLEQQAAVASMA